MSRYDTSPFKITSEIPMEVEGFEPPQEEEAPVRRSERPHRAHNRLCLNVEVEEHSLWDLNKPANYKATMLDPKSKIVAAMQYLICNIKDNRNPGEPHWTCVKTIHKYLTEILKLVLGYGRILKLRLRLNANINAGFETDRDEIKSQT
ncbi:hypothetical protein Tco_1211732 [Tanacetum coccineum]